MPRSAHRSPETALTTRRKSGLDEDASLVLSVITQHANLGVWVRNIPQQTGLTQPVVEKVLKKLVKDKLVKQVSSIKVRSRSTGPL